jgi:hypothetical protein
LLGAATAWNYSQREREPHIPGFEQAEDRSASFRRDLLNSLGLSKDDVKGRGCEAHHIVPVYQDGFQEARQALKEADPKIGINSPQNGALINHAGHVFIHNDPSYKNYVREQIGESLPTQTGGRLDDLRAQLMNDFSCL